MVRAQGGGNRAIDLLELFQIADGVIGSKFGAGKIVDCDNDHALRLLVRDALGSREAHVREANETVTQRG